MVLATEAGAIIMPPVPGFYSKPQSIDGIVNQTVGRALDLFGLELDGMKRWQGRETSPAS
jgi:4-hydroxy-3-polyprenylbenzoate decarboxylase